jgi:cellulose synthase/poly-beta-1,6-N-acetylglucosamine synthase-like glycosyltransferase
LLSQHFFLSLITSFLITLAFLLAVPIVVLLVECLAAQIPSRRQQSMAMPAPSVAVLVPAHDEAASIRPVLTQIRTQLSASDRLVVVADNCTDETATIARSAGATVIERHDPIRRGKGFALDYGVQFLASDPPDVVVVVDADCLVQPGALEQIARQAAATGCPVQATYLMEQPANPQARDAVSSLAFLVKNLVRPKGLAQLGLPCLLTGTGMAFPWAVIREASLASGNIVEDMQMAIDLTLDGHPALFCADARVIGQLPQQEQAAKSQRTRWEHGHLRTLLTNVPRLLQAAIQQRQLTLLAVALDLCIPPLSLLVMLWIAALILTGLAGLLGASSWLPAIAVGGEGVLISVAILSAWFKFGRTTLPAKRLLAIPFYLIWKLPLYLKFIVRPQTQWIRTQRDVASTAES